KTTLLSPTLSSHPKRNQNLHQHLNHLNYQLLLLRTSSPLSIDTFRDCQTCGSSFDCSSESCPSRRGRITL
ncbi:hypothetical protein GIB67_018747, partial [Kingdonia uniflora]